MKRLLQYTKQEQAQIKMAVLLLRFRCTTPTAASYKYMSYNKIAEALDITYNSV